ncbi:hypothetical protein PVAND_003552 [Polypedilum vanderplanki]|uniref:Bladder cancer-associated protein n=1 Tax=Polypedilum vanderplanki TaxID=319348 RepID=A0A9J6BW67_POLVA|nr:hypothetical protein PVAND_003552 [Polypedilum vanderplanki]
MYCLQCLLPVLLLPKPTEHNSFFIHRLFIILYLISFFLERKPCTICALVFVTAVFLLCQSGGYSCIFWKNCETS